MSTITAENAVSFEDLTSLPATKVVDCVQCSAKIALTLPVNYCHECDMPYDDQGQACVGVIEFDEL